MFNFIKRQYYKLLVMFYYYAGDFSSKIDGDEWGERYQRYMGLSFDYDEKINFWWWKYPTDDNQ